MHLVDFREIFQERLKRQARIAELQVHASGHCVHVGRISYACGWCFGARELFQLVVGTECMCRGTCPYCFFGSKVEVVHSGYRDNLDELFNLAMRYDWKPDLISYNSFGETLLALTNGYKASFLHAAAVIRRVEERQSYKIYKKLYTNGLLANDDTLATLKHDLDVTEIRFHLSASNFSEVVYENMQRARDMGFVVVVEEPSLPTHREQLFEMLPRIDAIGVKHFDICEVLITENSLEKLHALFPEGRMYKNHSYHLYDEGLAYDLIEEVIRKGYGFSIIDCSSDRERFARSQRLEALDPRDQEGVYAEWAARSTGQGSDG
jgi:pyruvate formate-lyase activating enzyme-like uncharacterized protein